MSAFGPTSSRRGRYGHANSLTLRPAVQRALSASLLRHLFAGFLVCRVPPMSAIFSLSLSYAASVYAYLPADAFSFICLRLSISSSSSSSSFFLAFLLWIGFVPAAEGQSIDRAWSFEADVLPAPEGIVADNVYLGERCFGGWLGGRNSVVICGDRRL